jgi:fibronectin-binding autotransporter adhesin
LRGVAMLVVLGLVSSSAQATKFWKNSIVTGNWNTGNNWSATSAAGADNAGVPVGGDVVNIVSTDGTARTVTYNVSAPSLGTLSIDLTGTGATTNTLSITGNNSLFANGILVGGYSGAGQTAGRGELDQSAGTVTTNSGWDLVVGHGANSTGNYTLSGTGALVANKSEYIGLNGTGTFNHSAGSNTINTSATGALEIGALAGSTGTYNLGGTGTLVANTNEYIGETGTGLFHQTGGSNSISQTHSLYLGYNAAGAGGTYMLDAGSLSLVGSSFELVGYNAAGDFVQSGGTNSNGGLSLGQNAGISGTYTLSGGSLNTVGFQYIGFNGTGTFIQTGGTNNALGGGDLEIGEGSGTTGTYSLSGGSAVVGEGIVVGTNFGLTGKGTLNVSGSGVLTEQSFGIAVSNAAGSSANLSGGTINTPSLNLNGMPSHFNWTSGTLNITSNVTWDPAASPTSTSTVFGASRLLDSGQTLIVTGNETLGGAGSFSLELGTGSTHQVTGSLTVGANGTLTQDNGSTLNAAAFTQAGGTVNGTLQNQGNFVYQSGPFNGRLLNQGTVSLGPSFTAPNGVENDATMTVAIGQTLTLNGAGLDNQGVFTLAGGTLNVSTMTSTGDFVFDSGTLSITGASGANVASIVSNTPHTTININANNVSLGNAASFTGFNHQGTLNVGANTVTLNSAGYAKLGVLTTLNGGTINAPNGVTFPSGSNFLGHGTGNARVTGESGAVIEADGALALGDAASPSGFSFGGELRTKQFAVTLNTSAIVGLGKLTTLGSGASAGTLNATNGFFVDFDEAITGFGTINSTNTLAKHATINGTVQGNSAGQPITLSGYIKGAGTFNNVTFTGTYSPGLSPTIATVGSITLAPTNTLLMEVGGTTAGGSYDQIQATDTLSLGGTLAVSLINGFAPAAGSSFDILDFIPGNLSGTFASLSLPSLAAGLTWNISQLYMNGLLSVVSVGLPGDYNNNGVVDAADYVVWRKGLGTTYTQSDYNVWRTHFGQTAGSGAGASTNAAVPEPTTLVLLMFAAIGLWLRRGRAA